MTTKTIDSSTKDVFSLPKAFWSNDREEVNCPCNPSFNDILNVRRAFFSMERKKIFKNEMYFYNKFFFSKSYIIFLFN